MNEGDEVTFAVESYSYTPAYDLLTYNSNTYYFTTTGTYAGTGDLTAITSSSNVTYGWGWDASSSISTDNVTLTSETNTPEKVTVSYIKHLSAEATPKLTATVTIPEPTNPTTVAEKLMTDDATLTGEATLTLTKRAKPTFSLTLPSEVYVGEKVDGSLTSTSDGTISYTYSVDNKSYSVDESNYITFTQDANNNFTVTGLAFPSGETSNSKLVTITASVPETENYLASTAEAKITVKKHPTTLAVTYDKTTLTYGDAYPTLQLCAVTDTHTNTTVSNASVSYSSSQTYARVNNTTGEITSITQAGDFTITAHYAGDGTYAAATDVTTAFTVNKATPTLTFPGDSYFVRFTEGFPDAPTATLTLKQNDTGSVTYSCTSSPEGLVTVDASTGKVTLAEVNSTREGTATITATFAGDDRYNEVTASYGLTVSTRAKPTFGVTMENSLYVGDNTHKITVTKNSSGTVTYESSNTNVLTVDNSGTMTAKKEGTADVTVQMAGDNDYIPMKATFTVTVKRYPTKLTLGTLEKEYYTDHGDIALTVSLEETVTNQPVSGETDKYTYASSNTSVLTVSQNASGVWVIKPVGAGIASVTVTFEGDDKYEGSHDSWQITVKRTAMPGDFIRIKNVDGYLSSSDGTSITTSATADASNIIYYGKDGDLLFYQCGHYISDAKPTLADVVDKDGKGTAFTFTRSGDKYTISAGTSNLCGATDLTVEEVDCLPVTFKDAGYGYSTFYSPVNLRTPAGVIAYYATARNTDPDGKVDYIITLKEVSHGVMPANTPLVLKASDITSVQTYDFYIIDETSTLDDALKDFMVGTLPTINTSSVYSTDSKQCPYTLQPTASAQTVGFYPWKKDKHGTIEPFRCYIPGDNVKSASQAKGFRFVFDDGETTGIDAAPSSATTDDSTIYNLQGTAVGKDLQSLPAGVYIQGGKKVMKGW